MSEDGAKRKRPLRGKMKMAEKVERFGDRWIAKFHPEVALEICERVAKGETLTQICKEPGMPNSATFWRWRMIYKDLDRAYRLARAISAETLEEEALDMARQLRDKRGWKSVDVMAFRTAMQQFRWSAERRNPEDFGGQPRGAGSAVQIVIQTSLPMGASGAEEIDSSTFVLTARLPEGADEEADPLAPLPEKPQRAILPKADKPGKTREDMIRERLRGALGLDEDETRPRGGDEDAA